MDLVMTLVDFSEFAATRVVIGLLVAAPVIAAYAWIYTKG